MPSMRSRSIRRLVLLTFLLAGSPPGVALAPAGPAFAQQRQRTPRARRRLALQLIQQGQRAMAEKKYSEAIRAFGEAQRLAPGERPLFLLGQAYEFAGEPKKAEETFHLIPRLVRSRMARQLTERGVARMAKRENAGAIADLSLASKLHPETQTSLLLGQSLELGGRLEAASKVYEQLLATAKGDDRASVEERLEAVKKRLEANPEKPKEGPPESMPTDLDDSKKVSLGDGRDDDVLAGDEAKGGGGGGDGTKAEGSGKKIEIGAGDKFQVGGRAYLRFQFKFSTGDSVNDHPFSMPNLADVYLDGRPNDRIRAFLQGRVSYNPSIDEHDPVVVAAGQKQFAVSMVEFWLKFDLARRVFLTFGQQLVRFGSTKIWNPVDMINTAKRPILSPLDERVGTPLVKVHIPIESLGWNFYAIGFAESVNTLDRWGAMGRGEFVFKTAELGLSAAYKDQVDPKVGIDLSVGVWDLDFMLEAGLRFNERFTRNVALRLSAGVQYSIRVFEDDQLVLSGEYFYNQEGSSDPSVVDIITGRAQFYYLGRHYGALSVALPSPGRLNDWTFAASSVANFNDLTLSAQLSVSAKFLTFLNVQLFVTGHFGHQGELRLGPHALPDDPDTRYKAINLLYPQESRCIAPVLDSAGHETTPAVCPSSIVPTQVLEVGLWFSVEI
jgi:tetratricopeptide (TPR) repeat protein